MVKTVFLATNVEMLQNYIPYIGFGFIGIIALCALIGFFRGYLKSNHYMIASLIIYVIGIILMISALPLAAIIAIVGRSKTLDLLDTLKFGFAPKKRTK